MANKRCRNVGKIPKYIKSSSTVSKKYINLYTCIKFYINSYYIVYNVKMITLFSSNLDIVQSFS